MARRWLPISAAVALAAGAVAWALAGLPGAPAACLPTRCDCEAAGAGPIRQPANAWSSLAFVAAGIAVLAASPAAGETGPQGAEGAGPGAAAAEPALTRHLAAGALVAAGPAAFLAHAGLTAWAARLDGIIVAMLVGALALHGLARFLRLSGSRKRPFPTAGAGCRRGGNAPAGRGGGTHPATLLLAPTPWLLLGAGALCWWLGRSGGPWCRPDSLLQAHAAWHVLAAGALGLWLSRGNPQQTRRPSSLLAERPTTT